MGLWDWLSGKRNRVPVRDSLWLTSAARYAGICRSIQEVEAGTDFVLVLAHFPATLDELKQALNEASIAHNGVGRTLSADTLQRHKATESGPRVLTGLVRQLQPDPFPNPNPDEQGKLDCLVVERHFMRKHDDAVHEFTSSLGRPAAITFHLSLEDPLLRPIGGDWIQGVLRRLGAQENAPISSELIARRIPGAQERYARQTSEEQDADSAEQWLERNAPGA